MKKTFSAILIVLVLLIALGGVAMIIRSSVITTPPDDENTPDVTTTPTEKPETLEFAGKEYSVGAEINAVSGLNVFRINFEEEYTVSVEWNADNETGSSLDYVCGGLFYGFDEKEYMKSVKVEKLGKRFYVTFPEIEKYLKTLHDVDVIDKIDYSAYTAFKFDLTVSYGDKQSKYVLNVDITKIIPESIKLDSEAICF